MQMSLVLALGVAKAAMATEMFMNGTNPAAAAESAAAPVAAASPAVSAAAAAAGAPETVGDGQLLGCGPTTGLTGFTKIAESKYMSFDLCAASCGKAKYFAVDDKQ